MIISHDNRKYREKWNLCGDNKWNGAFYYSKEIVKNIIPLIDTDRNWITVNMKGEGREHSIVFIHNNKRPENYEWLKKFNDLIFVCGVPETCEKVAHLGKTIYLPLSIDVEEVKQYAVKEKDKDVCFAGRPPKRRDIYLPPNIDNLEGMPRKKFLKELARYKEVYAVGRTAIEAKALGCKIKPYDPRFPDVDFWKVMDNKEAAKILQRELTKIDGPLIIDHERPEYKKARLRIGRNQWNGAYYYSKEIVENIIPNVDTDRNWITIKAGERGASHSICFVHNNLTFEDTYYFMKKYDDVVYVVGLPDMLERASKFGKAVYLPLSVDVEYVKQFERNKTKQTAFVGRPDIRPRLKRDYNIELPEDIDFIEGLPREDLLREMAKYKEVYAIGRTAIEAKILGCKVLSYHPRVPDPDMWQVIDNREAAKILQKELDKIDKPNNAEDDLTIWGPHSDTYYEPSINDLKEMTKAEVIEFAEKHEIKIDKRAKKADIIEKIKERCHAG